MFDRLFFPRALAVAGVSRTRLNPGRDFIDRQRAFGFEGDIYVARQDGLPVPGATVLQSWEELPDQVDYGFVAVPAAAVQEVVEHWAGRVGFIQIFSSGFREAGPAGGEREYRLLSAVTGTGTRVIGPNSWGIYSPDGGLTFGGPLPKEAGRIALISQSGAVALDAVIRVSRTGRRFAGAIAIGNSCDVTMEDLIAWFASRKVGALGVYCESVTNGRRLLECLEDCRGREIPVVFLKGGMTSQGAAAVSSHTGSVAGDGAVWASVLRQHDALLCHSIEQFSATLASADRRRCRGSEAGTRPGERVSCCVIGPGGGVGVLLADALGRVGIGVPRLPDSLVSDLERAGFPPGTSFTNPIDLPVYALEAGEVRPFEATLERVAAGHYVDTVLVHLNVTFIVTLLRAGAEVFQSLVRALSSVIAGHVAAPRWYVILRLTEYVRDRVMVETAVSELTKAGALVFASDDAAIEALSVEQRHA